MGKEAYLKKLFQAYYKSKASNFPPYSDLIMREFGFIQWDQPGMTRHKGFSDLPALLNFLQAVGPRHAYVSTTGYNHPERPDMKDKEMQYCDMVFDIDMDHLETSCKEEHDSWTCNACHKEGRGKPPVKCECGGTKFQEFNWLCDTCLNAAKRDFFKVLDFLQNDFGLESEKIQYYFSGNRGYHAHIEDPKFRKLDSDARREITDYITGIGLDLFALGLRKESGNEARVLGFTENTLGWGKKIIQKIILLIREAKSPEEIAEKTGIPTISANVIFFHKNEILTKFRRNQEQWWTFSNVTYNTWKKLCDYAISQIPPTIDIPVSLDVRRLIRLPDSLHGKTGFRVTQIPYDKMKDFDPFRDALVFGTQPLKVKMKGCPKFRIGDIVYGPYTAGEIVEIHAVAGIFALCQGVADLP